MNLTALRDQFRGMRSIPPDGETLPRLRAMVEAWTPTERQEVADAKIPIISRMCRATPTTNKPSNWAFVRPH